MKVALYTAKEWNAVTGDQLPNIAKLLEEINVRNMKLLDRILKLEQLVKLCSVGFKNNYVGHQLVPKIEKLQSAAILILKAIFNVRGYKGLILQLERTRERIANGSELIVVQNSNRTKDPHSLLINREARYDWMYKVKYHNEEEREEHRVINNKGALYQLKTNVNSDKETYLEFGPFSTKDRKERGFAHNGRGYAIIVVDKNGNIFVGNTNRYEVHHSSFVGGEKAFFAGTIKTNASGKIVEIFNTSGHYQPNSKEFLRVLRHLEKRNLISEKTKIFEICVGEKNVHDFKRINLSKLDEYYQGHLGSRFSYTRWKVNSSTAFFAKRPDNLKNIDSQVEDYYKNCNTNSVEENIELLNKILFNIRCIKNRQTSFNPLYKKLQKSDRKVKTTVEKLEQKILVEKFYWENITKKFDCEQLTFQ